MTITPSTPITTDSTIADTVRLARAQASNAIAFAEQKVMSETPLPHAGLSTAHLALREWLGKADLLETAGEVDWRTLTDAQDAIRHWLMTTPFDVTNASHRLAVEKAAEAMGTLNAAILRAMDIA